MFRISLIDSPPNMEPFFMNADIYVAAVFDGAGMKVKVAEALSYGLPVIGTDHAFIGYENIQCGKFVANKSKEFLIEIAKLCKLNDYRKLREDIFLEFKNNLSMNSSAMRYKNFIEKVIS